MQAPDLSLLFLSIVGSSVGCVLAVPLCVIAPSPCFFVTLKSKKPAAVLPRHAGDEDPYLMISVFTHFAHFMLLPIVAAIFYFHA